MQNHHRDQTMSSTSSSDPNKMHKNTFHWRNDSSELDVFEAARYFSASTANDHHHHHHHLSRPAGRRSLDAPIPPDYHHHIHIIDQKQLKDQSKRSSPKQPSSPGGRLATFLNSLFNQTPLKKKKKPPKSAAAAAEEESPGGRRRRRSSISHFRITSTAKNAAAAEGGSGFRTPPPPYANTPTKSYKELTRFAEQRAAVSPHVNGRRSDLKRSSVNGADCALMEEKLRVCEKINNGGNLKRLIDEDENDGGESDSSSDLFDLPNDFFWSSLPVYETTHMETRIRIAA